MSQPPADFLLRLFEAAYRSADPRLLKDWPLPPPPGGRTFVVGAGKAGAAMAQAFETMCEGTDGEVAGRTIHAGLVICPWGSRLPTRQIELREASHPIPDAAGVEATRDLLALLQDLDEEDEVIVLLSGGGSALLTAPTPGLSLEEKQALTSALLKSGAPIEDMNAVRKHLSSIKGGRLASAAAPARVITFAISDVVGNDPAVIASGPTAPDTTTLNEARAALKKWHLAVSPAVLRTLDDPGQETPKPDDRVFERCEWHLIAAPEAALRAASDFAVSEWPGLSIHPLGADLSGDVREGAALHVDKVRACLEQGGNHLILSGGEYTVTLAGRGGSGEDDNTEPVGGPNHEFLLALLRALDEDDLSRKEIYALAADTDGKDGNTGAAGALAGPDALPRTPAARKKMRDALDAHQSGRYFADAGLAIVTGPTHTNVNDFRAILILDQGSP